VATSDDLAKVLEAVSNGQTYEETDAPATTSTVDPASFTIEVQNGTDIVGAANTTANALAQKGFSIDHASTAEQQVYNETLVVYRTSATKGSGERSGLEQIYDQASQQGQQTEDVNDEYDEYGDEGDGTSSGESEKKAAEAAAKAEQEQIALGKARADAVIQALGMGRAVEGDMYYSFDADILVIIGYDYKPVA
jgi:hypothetical protein